MNIAKKRINKLCAILIIIALTISDFFVVGSSIVSYAVDTIKTNNSNVNFSAYFIGDDGEKLDEIGVSIDEGEVYLYVDVSVYNEGYFNGTIAINSSNFKLKEDVLSTGISEISGNTVTLNQINAGSTETIQLAVEPIIEDTITREGLVAETEVVLSGEYVNSKNVEKNKYVEISGTATVKLTWGSSEETEAELEAKLLTNSVYEIDGEEKRIVQVLVNSNITNNNYPIYSSDIKITVPDNVQDISVAARSVDSTNSNVEFGNENYAYNETEKIVEITVSNSDTNNISWNKECYDTFVITYVFDVNEYITEENINVTSVITTYDSKELTQTQDVHIEETENIDGVISYAVSTEEESIYKGKLYTGEEREYKVTNEINVNYLNIVDSIKLNCNEATYLAGEEEGNANIVYTQTKISKEEFIKIFGEDGSISIKNENGTVVAIINNDSETDEEGNIVINYENETKSLEIETSEPKSLGTLKVEHTKKIQNTGYSRETINAMTAIKEKITGTDNGETVEEETRIELKETETTASLNLDTTTISTTADSQTITVCATLKADDESKDLYKNPTVTITMPEEMKVIDGQYAVLYKNGLSVGDISINQNEDGRYQVTIQLNGEQTSYDSTGGTRVYVKLETTTSALTPSKTSNIELTYTNEYKNVINTTSREINFESQYGLMVYNQLSNYNNNGEQVTSLDSSTTQGTLSTNSDGKDAIFGTALINNYGETINDVTLIGRIPSGDGDDTYEATLKSIATDSSKAIITYSEDPDATADDDSWGEYTENSVSYKIEISEMEAEEIIKISATSTIPEDMGYAEKGSYTTETSCYYLGTEQTSSSSLVLATKANMSEVTAAIAETSSTDSGIETTISAYIGNDGITEEDEVYEGQTIRYEVTITNNSGTDYSNVTVKANQTNGYVWDDVTKEVFNVVTSDSLDNLNYYDEDWYEKTTSNEIELGTIETLADGESYTYEYEAYAYTIENVTGEQTYGTITISSDDIEEEVTTIKNTIKGAEISVDIIDGYACLIDVLAGRVVKARMVVTNLTDSVQENIEVQVAFSSNLIDEVFLTEDNEDFVTIEDEQTDENGNTIVTLSIASLNAGEEVSIELLPYTEETTESGTVWVLAEATTESGNRYTSNKFTREITNIGHDIEINQEGLHEDGTNINTESDYLNDGEQIKFVTTISNNDTEDVDIKLNYAFDKTINIEDATIEINSEVTDIKESIESNYIENYEMTIEKNTSITLTVTGTVNALNVESINNGVTIMDMETEYVLNSEYTALINTVSDEVDEDNTETNDDSEDDIYEDDDEDDNNSGFQYAVSAETNSTEENNDDNEIEQGSSSENNDDNETEQGSSTENNDDNETEQGNTSENNDDNETEQGNTSENNDSNETEQGSSSENTGTSTTTKTKTYKISGIAWLDKDKDGIRSSSEEIIEDMTVSAMNVDTQEIVSSTNTDENGEYSFTLDEGNYIIVFSYDNELYTTTTYQVSGANETENSDAIGREITMNGETLTAGTTDTLNLTQNLTNIDIGLIERNTFDLSIAKYVNKITVNNGGGVTTSEQNEGTTLAKTEIKSKYLSGSVVVIEYTIAVTNVGDVAGYAIDIVDNMPSTLEFNSSLNSNWYLSDGKLYNTSLANEKIEPGETKEITLVLTKTMTETNTGLINNTTQIAETSNSLGLEDETNDKGSADVIISVSTGTAVSYGVITIITLVVLVGIAYIINKKYLSKLI